MNVLVGIGDSWTQGEGGYPESLWKENNGRMWKPLSESKHLIPIENSNSWVKQLADILSYVPINLGQRAIGNRGAVKTLYLNNINDYPKGVIIFLLAPFSRFDFFSEDWKTEHYKFQTLHPGMANKDRNIFYTNNFYNEQAEAIETICNILEAQTFAKANGFDFIFANAFELKGKDYLIQQCPEIANKINWKCYLHEYVDYKCLAQLLVRKDGLCSDDYESVINYYPKMAYPATYMTNDFHPTIKGYRVIAEEIKRVFF